MIACPSCGEENPPKFRLCGYCGAPLHAAAAPPALPAHEVRKTVTIIFCDLVGSTALGERLDAEALHEVKDRYFAAMAAEITRHGGKIEKYIGDAIMAVFGLPRAHEDDALRAVRAALAMGTALERVNAGLGARFGVVLANRTGVNTGEVVATDDPTANQNLATGDAVNVAARLEQAAPPGAVYLGDMTYRLVRDAAEVEAVEPLELKGKAQRVGAHRLLRLRGIDGNVRRVDTPVVGREPEMAMLARVCAEVRDGRAARLVTVVGDAGAGKSRLVHEVVATVAADARVLRGRCLAYGEGITFWPLRGMLCDAAAIADDDPPVVAVEKVLAVVGDPDVADRLASATGLSSAVFPLHDINWATRKFLEELARDRPVVALIDDIHWAEGAFLALLEHVLDSSTGFPILLLTTARPDLFEERPQWAERAGASRMALPPLSDEATAQVIRNLVGSDSLPPDVARRIVQAAEGNPLYVEHMLSMLIESGVLQQEHGRWVRGQGETEFAVPPTIHALLEARLDGLGRAERATVEPAAVIGLEFAQPAVASLAPEAVRPTMVEHLTTLTRKQFIRVSRALEQEPIYRFHNQLVRDTIYNALLKRARARLHVGFVRWADRVNADRERAIEFEAILGYHLEQAHNYLRELGTLDEEGRAIGRDGSTRLASAARRAFARGDLDAAVKLFRRAVALLAQDDPTRLGLLPELAESLMGLGDFAATRGVLDEARAQADARGAQRVAAYTRVIDMMVQLYSGDQSPTWGDDTLKATEALVPVLDREQAHHELATAWRLVVMVHGMAGRYGLATEAVQRSLHHARIAGNESLVARNGIVLTMNALYGPTPVPEAIAECEELIAAGLADRQAERSIMCTLAQLKAMNGELDEARELYQHGRAMLRDLGQGVYAASTAIDLARVELLGGDLAMAEAEVRADYDFLARAGETYFLSTMAALLSKIVREQGRDEEALELSKTAEAATAADDMESQSLWRSIRAPILARSGDIVAAAELAWTALELVRQMEAPNLQADASFELATVLRMAGRAEEAGRVMGEALALYEAKGNVVAAERARSFLGTPAAG